MVLPIINAMQSLQGLLTSISGGLSSITGAISGIGSAFSGVFDNLGEIASNAFSDIIDTIGGVKDEVSDGLGSAFDGVTNTLGGVKDEVEDQLGSAFDFLKGKFGGIFDKKKVEEAIAPVKTAMEISETGYADAIIRDKIKEEQIASARVRNQQKADIAAMQNYAASKGGTVNVTVNAGGITDRTDKKQMALEIGNEIQRELARFNAGLTKRPRL